MYTQIRHKLLVTVMYYLDDHEFKVGTSTEFFSYTNKKDVQNMMVELMQRLLGFKHEDSLEELDLMLPTLP